MLESENAERCGWCQWKKEEREGKKLEFFFSFFSLSLSSKRGPTLFSFTHEIQVHLRWNIGIVCLARGGRMISPLPYPRFWLPYSPARLRPGKIGKRDRQSAEGRGKTLVSKTARFPASPVRSSERQIQNNDVFRWRAAPSSRPAWFLKRLQRVHPLPSCPLPRRWATPTPIRECQQINANLLNIYVPPRRHRPRNIFPLFYSAACQYWAARRNGLFGCLPR